MAEQEINIKTASTEASITTPSPQDHTSLVRGLINGIYSSRRAIALFLAALFGFKYLCDIVIMVCAFFLKIKASPEFQLHFFQLYEKTTDYAFGLLMACLGLVTGSQLLSAFGVKMQASVVKALTGQAENVVNQKINTQNVKTGEVSDPVVNTGVNKTAAQPVQPVKPAAAKIVDQGGENDLAMSEDIDEDLSSVAQKQQEANDNKQSNQNIQPKE